LNYGIVRVHVKLVATCLPRLHGCYISVIVEWRVTHVYVYTENRFLVRVVVGVRWYVLGSVDCDGLVPPPGELVKLMLISRSTASHSFARHGGWVNLWVELGRFRSSLRSMWIHRVVTVTLFRINMV